LLARLCEPPTVQPLLHRVRCATATPRLSLLYEMRLREADVAAWMCHREAKALGLV
jgi:hypothetical protein